MTLKLIQNTHIHPYHDTITRNNSRADFSGCKKADLRHKTRWTEEDSEIVKRCKWVSETKTGNMRKIGQLFGNKFSWLRNSTRSNKTLLPSLHFHMFHGSNFLFFYVTQTRNCLLFLHPTFFSSYSRLFFSY